MKTTKRFIAMTAALTLTACMAMPMASFATDVYVNTEGSAAGQADTEVHTYTAYPIFTGTYANGGLQVSGWATGYNSSTLLSSAAFQAIATSDSSTIGVKLNAITGTPSAAQVAQILDLVTDSAQKDALAKVLYANKGNAVGVPLSQSSTSKTNLTQGYYVVDDVYSQTTTTGEDPNTVTTDNGKTDAKSKFVLKVAGDDAITITPKKSYPTVVKKVQENTDVTDYNGMGESGNTNYNDVADYCIGSAVPFKLYGSMPATLADYSGYYYKFTDTLGTQFDQPAEVTINVGSTTIVASKPASGDTYTFDAPNADDKNCRVKWDATNHKLTISFEDITKYSGVDKDTIVTVTYSAVLNATAEMGRPGQENAVKLTYSNNPNVDYKPTTTDENDDSDDDTDETPEDKVIVFTYELDITKEDKDTGAKLSGAKFKLANAATAGNYAILNSKTVSGKTKVYTFGGWDTTGTGTVIETDSNGIFYILGLDEGTYWLDETEAPDEYSGLSARKKMTLTADTLDTGNNQAWSGVVADALTSLKLKIDEGSDNETTNTDKKLVAATIVNTKSNELPSTGGIGTTLFILGGGCAAGLAGIYLVSKKKTREEE